MTVTLYTRSGCHLCDDAKREIGEAGKVAEFRYEEVDIDSDPGLRARYNEEVPVVTIDGRRAFKYRLTAAELVRKLAAR